MSAGTILGLWAALALLLCLLNYRHSRWMERDKQDSGKAEE